jgi:glycosyltransferase involved in cell wall biosynthesis
MTLSVAIITLNEAANLARTLDSVRWANELIVVDSGSTDDTISIAEAHGAKAFREAWRGFGAQKNFALDQCSSDWILSLDADEEVSAALGEEIRALLSGAPEYDAYFVNRRNIFLGKWLRHGGMYPDPKLRLIKNGEARFAERPVHEDIYYAGEPGHLRGDLLHSMHTEVATYVEHLERYSTLAAGTVAEGRIHSGAWYAAHTLLNPYLTFFYNYIVRGGFLDGREGLIYHAYHSSYVSWKYAKAWEISRERRRSAKG